MSEEKEQKKEEPKDLEIGVEDEVGTEEQIS